MLRFIIVITGLVLGLCSLAASATDSAPTQIELADTDLSRTAEQRELLSYLVSCALPKDVTLYSDVDGERYTFPGSLGLAPDWLNKSLTETEQRWVSACIFARTNYFGKPVAISLRARNPAPATLAASAEEQESFTLYEGAFFGNLFSPQPFAYTCAAPHSSEHASAPVLKDRVCTEPDSKRTADGQTLSRCGFIHAGSCGPLENISLHGKPYNEVIFIYLKPG